MQPAKGPDYTRILLVAVLLLVSLLLLLRVYPPVAFMAFAIGTTVGFFLLGGKLGSHFFGRRSAGAHADEGDFQHRVATRLDDCRRREERFRDEGEQIMHSITALRDDLDRNPQVDTHERRRAEEIIRELEAEFSLRHAKAGFFSDCAERLRELLDRHRLVQSIEARRQELRNLRKTNFDDEAAAEETRYHIEQDGTELDTIVELSKHAVDTDKTEQTEVLRDRLEKLRRHLGKQSPARENS